jgi:hypothetical protein
MQFLCSSERAIISRLLDDAAAAGFIVSVFDGEVWALTASSDFPAVAALVGATGETTLRFRDPSTLNERGKPALVGFVFLVHGNGSDVISDYSDTPALSALLAGASGVAERLAVLA